MKVSRFISAYLKVVDIKKPQVVTFSTAEAKEFRRDNEDPETKLVLYFEELEQGVVAGKVVLQSLTDLFGDDDTDKWVGKKATLYVDAAVMMGSKRVGGLRFRAAESK